MIGAGTVINPIIKIATTVAILAAVYFFIVKPALDTTENITHSVNHTVNRSLNDVNKQVNGAFGDLDKKQKQKVSKSIHGTSVNVPDVKIPNSAKAQLKIAECVQKAAPDTAKIQACVNQ